MSPSNFSLKVASSGKNLYKVEGFIEDVCDYFNVFNVYFGNILVATSEFYSFVGFLFPGKLIEINSCVKKGALVVGFDLQNEFYEVAPFLQQNISKYIESETISEEERSLLSTILLSDDIFLDFAQQKVELLFNIKAGAKEREAKISKYIGRVVGTSTVKHRKKV